MRALVKCNILPRLMEQGKHYQERLKQSIWHFTVDNLEEVMICLGGSYYWDAGRWRRVQVSQGASWRWQRRGGGGHTTTLDFRGAVKLKFNIAR